MFLKLKSKEPCKKGSEKKTEVPLCTLIPESAERFKLYSLELLFSVLDFQLFEGI